MEIQSIFCDFYFAEKIHDCGGCVGSTCAIQMARLITKVGKHFHKNSVLITNTQILKTSVGSKTLAKDGLLL